MKKECFHGQKFTGYRSFFLRWKHFFFGAETWLTGLQTVGMSHGICCKSHKHEEQQKKIIKSILFGHWPVVTRGFVFVSSHEHYHCQSTKEALGRWLSNKYIWFIITIISINPYQRRWVPNKKKLRIFIVNV